MILYHIFAPLYTSILRVFDGGLSADGVGSEGENELLKFRCESTRLCKISFVGRWGFSGVFVSRQNTGVWQASPEVGRLRLNLQSSIFNLQSSSSGRAERFTEDGCACNGAKLNDSHEAHSAHPSHQKKLGANPEMDCACAPSLVVVRRCFAYAILAKSRVANDARKWATR